MDDLLTNEQPAADNNAPNNDSVDNKPADDKPAENNTPLDGKPAEDKPADDKSEQKPGAPEKYEFKPPEEGAEFDKKFIEVYSEVARELDMSQEAAQKILDKVGPVVRQQQIDQIEAVRNKWTEDSHIDKEFGGDKLNENLAVAKKALDQFGTPELTQFMKDTGLGNHPEIIRFFYRVGKNFEGDEFVGGKKGEGKTGPKTFNDLAAKLYGNS